MVSVLSWEEHLGSIIDIGQSMIKSYQGKPIQPVLLSETRKFLLCVVCSRKPPTMREHYVLLANKRLATVEANLKPRSAKHANIYSQTGRSHPT
jgi:hypothetical protein